MSYLTLQFEDHPDPTALDEALASVPKAVRPGWCRTAAVANRFILALSQLALGGFVGLLLYVWFKPPGPPGLYVFAFAIAAQWLLWGLPDRLARNWRKRQPRYAAYFLSPRSWEFDPKGVRIVGSGIEARFDWAHVNAVRLGTRGLALDVAGVQFVLSRSDQLRPEVLADLAAQIDLWRRKTVPQSDN